MKKSGIIAQKNRKPGSGRAVNTWNPKPPAVVVVGNFMPKKDGFAQESWGAINDIHNGTSLDFGRTKPPLARGSSIRSRPRASQVRFPKELLQPVRVNDRGYAGSFEFRKRLYSQFEQFDVWGVISCSTAENCSELLTALEPIDVPILIALDNTVERSRVSNPNLLQLIPNNALQAQAILSKVAAELGEKGDHTVHVYCSRPQDDFVRDLLTELENKANDSQNHRIRLKQMGVDAVAEVGQALEENDLLIYVGYSEGLDRLRRVVKPKLILCDGCYERGAQNKMEEWLRPYFLARPSLDSRIYACQAYSILNDVWLDTKLHSFRWPPDRRTLSLTSRIRLGLEKKFSYRFVGSANQSGGYVILKYPR